MQLDTTKPLRILTWHIHGSYLYYLTQTPCIFYLPVKTDPSEGYNGRGGTFPWGDNVIEVSIDEIKNIAFDCILFQSHKNYLIDQYEILTEKQRELPKIYLEHDPPREVPTDTRHPVDDPNMLLVHVTHFNRLMWNNNRTPTRVIEHGVILPEKISYTGTKARGIVVINNIAKRRRRLGLDIFQEVRQKIPLDLVGMNSKEVGGLGEIPLPELPAFLTQYRFFFNPIRYTSMGLAVCEAMLAGMPIVGLATTEMAVAIENGVSGYIHTNVDDLIYKMKLLLNDLSHSQKLSQGAKAAAERQFNIQRFVADWLETFQQETAGNTSQQSLSLS
ncbi:glycosyltransferase family 4 protein [Olivibacter ginsenosidimutans]|uniref:Glycosyltransferase family 4 protein n=1 Tax=Olivibacter ginsenosidimutans TaxID=1176537 RepID=A0ABP9AF53_9SPHI